MIFIISLSAVEHAHNANHLVRNYSKRHNIYPAKDQNVKRVFIVAVALGNKTVVGRIIRG
jgi:hypothetical protein